MTSGSIDIKALNWLKGEIGETLDNIRQALEVYVDQQDIAKLDYIISSLHQITGTLHIVELFGPALLSEEMEHLARAVKNGQVKQAQDAYETLTRGILQLPAYLEHMRLGHKDQPVVLLSLLNDLRSAHGQPLLSESTLFSPDLNTYPPTAASPAPGNARATVKKLRTVFQTALLGWFRDANAANHLKKLALVLSQLDAATQNDAARQLWWITNGLVESLTDNGVTASVAVKSLLGQIDRQIKRIVDGGDTAIQEQRPLELLKNLLFYVAQSKSKGPRVSELQAAFKLAELLPDAGDLSKAESDLLGAGAGIMDNVAGAIREDLLSIKDTIDLFVRSKDHPLSELEPVAGKLRTVGDTLGILGLGRLRKAVKDQETVLKDILSGAQPLTDDAVMNVASTLLYVESSLTDLHRGDTDVPAVSGDIVESPLPENEYRALVSHTVVEARSVLGKIKDSIVQFLASPGAFDILEQIPKLANDIRGALTVMGYSQAATLLQLASSYISGDILVKRADIAQQDLDSLADAITGIEYFLESIEDDPVGAQNSLVLARIALKQLGLEAPGDGAHDNIPVLLTPEIAPPAAANVDVPIDFETGHIDDSVPTMGPAIVAPSTPPKVTVATDKPEVDEEVREIFLEEASEEAASITANLAAWRQNVENNEALRTLRRSFHTIKGSGRIVGAMEIGEFAWSVENMLNRVIDHTIDASPAVFGVIEEASGLLPLLIEELRANTSGGVNIQPMIDRAQRIAKGESLDEIPATPVPVVAAPPDALEETLLGIANDVLANEPAFDENAVPEENIFAAEPPAERAETRGMDPVLAEIFANEAHTHLATLEQYIAACRGAIEPCYVNEVVIRAMHTLTGSSHLANIGDIAELADALEKLAKSMYENRSAITPDALAIVADCVTYFRSAVAQLNRLGELQGTKNELLARVKALRSAETQLQSERLSAAPSEFAAASRTVSTEVPADAELLDVFLLEAADALGKNITAIDVWSALPAQRDYADEIRRRLSTLAGGARVANLGSVAQVCSASSQLVGRLLDSDGGHGAEVIPVIRRAHDWLSDALDIIKGHSVLDHPTGLLDELDSYSMVLSAMQPSTEEPAVIDAAPAPDHEGDRELKSIFLDEATEILARIDEIMHLWRDAMTDRAVVEDLQRALHTLKGGARMANIDAVGDVSHAVETLLTRVVDGLLAANGALFDLIQSAHDWINHSVDALRNGLPFSDHSELLRRLDAFESREAASGVEPEDVELEPVPEINDSEARVIPFPRAAEAAANEAAKPVEYDDDLVDIFLEEGNEILHSIDDLVARWGKDPENKTIIAELQRALHTLKGGARMARVTPVGDLSHNIENILESIGQGRMRANPQLIELMHSAYDWLATALERVRAKTRLDSAEPLIGRILVAVGLRAEDAEVAAAEEAEAALEDHDASATIAVAGGNAALEEMMQARGEQAMPAGAPMEAEAKSKTPGEQVRVALALLDSLVNNAGEVSIYRSRIELQLNSTRFNLVELAQTVNRLREQLRKFEIEAEAQILFRYEQSGGADRNDDFDPLELDRFSNMQQLSRSLVETVGDLGSVQKMLDNLTRESEILLLQQSRVTSTLQDGLMRTRLVPFSSVVPRLRRIVRQTAKELGKQVELMVIGAEGEMDRSVLNRLTPALEHLLRNGVDHGVESPKQRAKANKPPTGTITLRFWRDGPEIALAITDDGGGLDLKAIRAKAIERGLMVEGSDMSDNEVMQFVLESGFSTAKKITQISGRGVGMDVVNNEIKQLNGNLHIASTPGVGTTFTVRLPLTVSVNQALMVNAGEQVYAIPLSSIDGVVRVTRDELRALNDGENAHFDYAGHSYRFFHLGRMLNVSQPQVPVDNVKVPLILARAGDHRVALWVESIVSRQEVVIKSVGPQVSTVTGISGATILSDGGVALILDISSLIRSGLAHMAKSYVPMAAPVEARAATVMVVDDSITVRRVTERLLKRHEFEIMLAKDGVDALAQLQERIPDVMLLDIEMPRMDGYELATAMRNDARLKQIPIIMITSRTGDKHRERAMAIGVNMYMGKPYQETELLENINKLLEVK